MPGILLNDKLHTVYTVKW